MKKILATAVAVLALGAAAPANAAVNPVLEVVLFPLVKLAEFQSSVSPEKDSCWNEGRRNVVGCRVSDQVEARPTTFD